MMADGSVFSSQEHINALVESGEKYRVSATLFRILFEESKNNRRSALSSLGWRDLPLEPSERLNKILVPYEHKIEYVSPLLDKIPESQRETQTTSVLLDQYSFLKEHSSLLLRTRRTLRLLRGWGVVTLDLSNRAYDLKHHALQKLRGPRWLLALAVAGAGISQLTADPLLAGVSFLGGAFIVVMDP
jgi:hypothetical protein